MENKTIGLLPTLLGTAFIVLAPFWGSYLIDKYLSNI